MEVKLERVNLVRQLGVECGEAVIHYVELEVRQAMGEGWGQSQDSLWTAVVK